MREKLVRLLKVEYFESFVTAKKILDRLGIQTSSSFVKI